MHAWPLIASSHCPTDDTELHARVASSRCEQDRYFEFVQTPADYAADSIHNARCDDATRASGELRRVGRCELATTLTVGK